jgi:hypothetical protein
VIAAFDQLETDPEICLTSDMIGEGTKMCAPKHVLLAVIAVLIAVILSLGNRVWAQNAPQGEPSAVEACNQFQNALKPTPPKNKSNPPDRIEQGLGQLGNTGQLGIACGKALAKLFESLRKNGGNGSWSEIENEIDRVIDTYRKLIETIEGTGGVYEEGGRAVAVLDSNIQDMAKRRDPNYEPLVNARKVKDALTRELELTKKLKGALDRALVDMQSQKREIAEQQGTQRYAAAQRAIESLNVGLAQVIDELVRAQKKPGS